jgi:hypothetical protein
MPIADRFGLSMREVDRPSDCQRKFTMNESHGKPIAYVNSTIIDLFRTPRPSTSAKRDVVLAAGTSQVNFL